MWYSFVDVEIHLENIVKNFLFLQKSCSSLVPVIKADAYGHGLIPVARALTHAGAKAFAVGSVEEGVALRLMPFEGDIISLLGPVEQRDFKLICEYNIIPFVYHFEQIENLGEIAKRQCPVALKFDTGMARLGFTEKDIPRIIDKLRFYSNLELKIVASHLALADSVENDFVLEQVKRFNNICQMLTQAGFKFKKSLANSAGILAWPETYYDFARPGIALYGGNPFWGTNWQEKGVSLRPAMKVRAPLVNVRSLSKGETISYGRTFRAPSDMKVGIVAVGYADNYSRSLSNKGWVVIKDKRCPIIGRVCMQMMAVDITGIQSIERGDMAYLLGGRNVSILPEELAEWWNTISYEVFCVLGQNNRIYV